MYEAVEANNLGVVDFCLRCREIDVSMPTVRAADAPVLAKRTASIH
jgi:hypothetical protein